MGCEFIIQRLLQGLMDVEGQMHVFWMEPSWVLFSGAVVFHWLDTCGLTSVGSGDFQLYNNGFPLVEVLLEQLMKSSCSSKLPPQRDGESGQRLFDG